MGVKTKLLCLYFCSVLFAHNKFYYFLFVCTLNTYQKCLFTQYFGHGPNWYKFLPIKWNVINIDPWVKMIFLLLLQYTVLQAHLLAQTIHPRSGWLEELSLELCRMSLGICLSLAKIQTVTSIPINLRRSQVPRWGNRVAQHVRRSSWGNITEERRETVHATYWNMTYQENTAFIFPRVSEHQMARLTSAGPSTHSRSLSYHLTNNLGQSQEVCKTFFLTTLGYHPNSHRKQRPIKFDNHEEYRRRYVPANKINFNKFTNTLNQLIQ